VLFKSCVSCIFVIDRDEYPCTVSSIIAKEKVYKRRYNIHRGLQTLSTSTGPRPYNYKKNNKHDLSKAQERKKIGAFQLALLLEPSDSSLLDDIQHSFRTRTKADAQKADVPMLPFDPYLLI